MENVLQINFIVIILILSNFAAFLDHTKENADVSKLMAVFRLIFVFTDSTCLRLLLFYFAYLNQELCGNCFI